MEDETVNLVIAYQKAESEGCKQACSELYEAIRANCAHIIKSVCKANKHTAIQDFVDEKLLDCLRTFSTEKGGNFRSMYRKSLANQLIDLHRKCKRLRTVSSLKSSEGKLADALDLIPDQREDIFDLLANKESLAIYRHQKRKLLDRLVLSPAHKMSTLLLDQRQRVASLHGGNQFSLDDEPSLSCRAWVEHVEHWSSTDEVRVLASGEPSILAIWEAFSERADQASAISQSDMHAAITASGGQVAFTTWRKRVSRYLHDVREQVDDEKWAYFHSTL